MGTTSASGSRRRLALAVTLVAAAGVTGLHSIATRDHPRARVAVAPPTSTTVTRATSMTTTTPTTTPPAVKGDSGALQQFTPISATTWWAVIEANLKVKSWVVRTADAGKHWRNVSPTLKLAGSSYFLNGDAAWIEAGSIGYPESEPVYRTLDGGTSWQRVGSVPADCELQFVDELHGWCTLIGAAMGSESVDLWRTADGGKTWTRVSRSTFAGTGAPSSTPGAIPVGCDKSVTFTSPTVGWAPDLCAGGNALLFRSTDGGTTWQPVPNVPLPTVIESGSGFGTPVVRGSHIALTATVFGQPGVTVIDTSSDGGATWHMHPLPGPTKQWNVDLIDPTHWRLGAGKVLMATDDAGKHWRTTISATPLPPKFLTRDLGWAIPGMNGGPLSWSVDGGASWKPIAIAARPFGVATPPQA